MLIHFWDNYDINACAVVTIPDLQCTVNSFHCLYDSILCYVIPTTVTMRFTKLTHFQFIKRL